jgi:hypothetical protein
VLCMEIYVTFWSCVYVMYGNVCNVLNCVYVMYGNVCNVLELRVRYV